VIGLRTSLLYMTISILLLASVTGPVFAYSSNISDGSDISAGLSYLRSAQTADGDIGGFANSAWVIMAIVASGDYPHAWRIGEDVPSIVDYLKGNAYQLGDKATDCARYILALTAAGGKPQNFGGVDYLTKMKSFYKSGQIGDEGLLNDDFWGILALISAGERQSSEIIQASKNYILDSQNNDGGWSYAAGQPSDVDDTAAAIMALISAGEKPSSKPVEKAFSYLRTNQGDDGGFPWSSSADVSNSISTSWAICAINAAGQNPTGVEWAKGDLNPVDFLKSMQDSDGAFKWTSFSRSGPQYTTACAITALTGKTYPVFIDPAVTLRIEGETSTIWTGTVSPIGPYNKVCHNSNKTATIPGNTPLGVLHAACLAQNINYTVSDAYYPAWDLFVDSIAGEENAGMNGWQVMVNGVSPNDYGACFGWQQSNTSVLANDDEVLWYYSTSWGMKPLKISVSATSASEGDGITVTVTTTAEAYTHNANTTWRTVSWIPVSGATIKPVGGTTGTDGTAQISPREGTHNIYAEKDGFIRSNKVTLTISGAGGYSSEQLQAIDSAQTNLASGSNVEDAYSLLKDTGIFGSEIASIPEDNQVYEDLIKQYGEQLEGYPSFEGRIQLLHAMGIEDIEIEMPVQATSPPPLSPNPEEVVAEAEATLESTGNVEEAYSLLVQNGLISEEIPAIPEDSPIYPSFIEQYGPQLERFPSVEGRLQLLKAMGIENLSQV